MTSYRLPHHGNRSFTFVQDDDWRFPHYDALPSPVILNGRKNAVWERRETEQWHRVKNLLLGWRLTVFLTTVIDPSRSFRMTTDAFLIMTPYRPRSFWMDARMLFEKDGKRNSDTEWRIYYSDDVLPSSSPRVYRSFTFVQDDDWRFPHYDALPSPVILNEDKNAVGESQKTATWHRVKNLLRWWRLAANS